MKEKCIEKNSLSAGRDSASLKNEGINVTCLDEKMEEMPVCVELSEGEPDYGIECYQNDDPKIIRWDYSQCRSYSGTTEIF